MPNEIRNYFIVPLHEVDPVSFLMQLQVHFRNHLVDDDHRETRALVMTREMVDIITEGLGHVANQLDDLMENRECR